MLMVREIFMERQFAFPSILLCIPLNPLGSPLNPQGRCPKGTVGE